MPSALLPVRFLPAGDTALVVEFGDTVDRAISDRVLALADRLQGRAISGLVEVVPTFRSLMIHFDPLVIGADEMETEVRPLLDNLATVRHSARLWTLPVCYDGDLGPDLAEVAERTRHSPDEVVRLIAEVNYHVYTLGFLPGYPYMGDGPEALSLPRRETPRIKVPRGSARSARLPAVRRLLAGQPRWMASAGTHTGSPVRSASPRAGAAVARRQGPFRAGAA